MSVFAYLQGIFTGIAASGANPRNLTLAPESPNASSSGTAPGTPGSVIVPLAAPVSTGNEGAFQITRAGTFVAGIQPLSGSPTFTGIYLASTSQPAFQSNGATLGVGLNSTQIQFLPGTALFGALYGSGNRGWQFGFPGAATFGGGDNVIGISVALTDPSSNPSSGSGVLWENVAGTALMHRGSRGAVSGLAPAGSAGTVNSQTQGYMPVIGTCETVSSNTPTAILTFTTTSGTGGYMNLRCISRATTTGTGVGVGDSACSQYVLGFKNVSGTVTLSTAGISLISGSNQTTAAALTAPVLTATVATNVITIKVTNVNLCTIDSQLSGEVDAC